jgi:uncharacterized LabA/DUF88 family protein
MTKTAFMIDGGFFKKYCRNKWGKLSPHEAADKVKQLCEAHLKHEGLCELYRIFYYDCRPSEKKVYHPLQKSIRDLSESPQYIWAANFHKELNKLRKMAIRFGRIADDYLDYTIKPNAVKEILNGTKSISSLTDEDLMLTVTQKGVDMRIGLDIASMAHKKQVTQIVLISGDSDFIPIIKYARKEGIDFILDSIGAHIKPELYEHLDAHRDLSPLIT